MTRKRIAVLTAQADEYTQGRFLSGFFEKAFQLDYDVCVFSMYLKYQDTASREVGDANIFNLIEFDKYDAVVICTDRIRTPGTEESHIACMFAMAFGVAPIPNPHVPADRTAAS